MAKSELFFVDADPIAEMVAQQFPVLGKSVTREAAIGAFIHPSVFNESKITEEFDTRRFEDIGSKSIKAVAAWQLSKFGIVSDLLKISSAFDSFFGSYSERLFDAFGFDIEMAIVAGSAGTDVEPDSLKRMVIDRLIGFSLTTNRGSTLDWLTTMTEPVVQECLAAVVPHGDPISKAQELLQAGNGSAPHYTYRSTTDKNGSEIFHADMWVGDVRLGSGKGPGKKTARKLAATEFLISRESGGSQSERNGESTAALFTPWNRLDDDPEDADESMIGMLRTHGISTQQTNVFTTAITEPSYINEIQSDRFTSDNRWLAWVGARVWDLWCELFVAESSRSGSEARALRTSLDSQRFRAFERICPLEMLRVSRGMVVNGIPRKVLAKLLMAYVSAIAITEGIEFTIEWLSQKLSTELETSELASANPTTRLQEITQADNGELPEYKITFVRSGQKQEYLAEVWIGGSLVGSGLASTKRKARQIAALVAMEKISIG